MEANYTDVNFLEETSTIYNNSTNDVENMVPDDSYAFIFVPFAVLATVLALSAMVFLMIRHRRTYRRSDCRVPYFSFDSPGTSDEEHQSETERILNRKTFYESFEITELNKKCDLYTSQL